MAQCAAPWSFLHGALMAHGAHLGRWQHPHLILRQGIDNLCYNKWPPQRSFPFREPPQKAHGLKPDRPQARIVGIPPRPDRIDLEQASRGSLDACR